MASVPGPQPGRPLPTPGAPAEEPVHAPEEQPGVSEPDRGADPEWLPRPYDPEREYEEPELPAGV